MRIYLAQKAMLIVVTLAIASTARAQTASTSFSATQRHDIELIVRNYLIENPEVLREASINLNVALKKHNAIHRLRLLQSTTTNSSRPAAASS